MSSKLTPGTPQNSVICPTGTPPPNITSICLQNVINERVLPCFERISFAVSCRDASAAGVLVNDDSTALMIPKATSGVTLSSCDNSKGCIDCKSDTNRKPFLSSKSTVLLANGNVDTSLVLAMLKFCTVQQEMSCSCLAQFNFECYRTPIRYMKQKFCLAFPCVVTAVSVLLQQKLLAMH